MICANCRRALFYWRNTSKKRSFTGLWMHWDIDVLSSNLDGARYWKYRLCTGILLDPNNRFRAASPVSKPRIS